MCENCEAHLRTIKEAIHISSLVFSSTTAMIADQTCCESMREVALSYWSKVGIVLNIMLNDLSSTIHETGSPAEIARLEAIVTAYMKEILPILAILNDFADLDRPNINLDWGLIFGEDSSLV